MDRARNFIGYAIGLSLLPLVAILVTALSTDVSAVPYLVRDVTAVGGLHPFAGFLSNLGAFLWFATGSIAVFAGLIELQRDRREEALFLFSAGALTFYLWFDDFFLLHEELVRRYLGLSDKWVFLGIAAGLVAYLWRFRRMIVSHRYPLLGGAIMLFAFSVAWDVVADRKWVAFGDWSYLVEDSAKWLGVVCWACFHIEAAFVTACAQSRLQSDTSEIAQFDGLRRERMIDG